MAEFAPGIVAAARRRSPVSTRVFWTIRIHVCSLRTAATCCLPIASAPTI